MRYKNAKYLPYPHIFLTNLFLFEVKLWQPLIFPVNAPLSDLQNHVAGRDLNPVSSIRLIVTLAAPNTSTRTLAANPQ